jgi:hypothetical protein
MLRQLRFAALAVAVFVTASCSGDGGTAPPKPASVALSSSATITGTAGSVLATAPTFVVRDASGTALNGIGVTVAVSAGGGTLTGAPTTSVAGGTSVGTWTLGTTAGANALTVTVSGLAPITVSATGTAGAPAKILVVSGGQQGGFAGAATTSPLVLRVADQFNNGVSGQAVAFSITGGGGSLAGATTVTSDLGGNVTAPTWTFGKSAVTQQVTATAGALRVDVPATVLTSYTMDVRFWGPAMPAATQQIFINAAARIRAAVIGQLSTVNLSNYDLANVNGCGVTGQAPLTEQPNGVIIYASVGPIDGVGKVIGRAGPCAFRSSNLIPVIGVMQFDEADIQNLLADGRFQDVVLHEMLHVVGVGTMWDPTFKNLRINGGTVNSAYTGPQAITGCLAANGGGVCTPTIPLENTGGAGTADGHWRESVFRTELMTGFVSAVGIVNPFSAMTIGSIGDLGYTVNSAAADNYTVPTAAGIQFGLIREAQGAPSELRDELIIPQHSISPSGKVTRIVRTP